jgi:hypothetical protein
MARTALTVQQIVRAGLTPSYSAANVDGHSIANGGEREFLHVKTGSTACDVTIVTPGTVDGLAVADRTISIGTSSERMIGPFPRAQYNQADETVHANFSAVTQVTCAAIRI